MDEQGIFFPLLGQFFQFLKMEGGTPSLPASLTSSIYMSP